MTLTEENGLRVLRPDPGHVIYRQGDENNFATLYYLGVNDSPDNFTEITEEEAEARKTEVNSEDAANQPA